MHGLGRPPWQTTRRAPVDQPNTAGEVNGFRERQIGPSTG